MLNFIKKTTKTKQIDPVLPKASKNKQEIYIEPSVDQLHSMMNARRIQDGYKQVSGPYVLPLSL